MSSDLEEATRVDVANLYKEEVITDLKVATIQKLTPIKVDGTDDSSREVKFSGRTNILTQMGPMPVSCDLPGPELTDAIEGFPVAIRAAVEEMAEEARKAMNDRQSGIVVPNAGGGLMGGPGGAMPGAGGGIQLA